MTFRQNICLVIGLNDQHICVLLCVNIMSQIKNNGGSAINVPALGIPSHVSMVNPPILKAAEEFDNLSETFAGPDQHN